MLNSRGFFFAAISMSLLVQHLNKQRGKDTNLNEQKFFSSFAVLRWISGEWKRRGGNSDELNDSSDLFIFKFRFEYVGYGIK